MSDCIRTHPYMTVYACVVWGGAQGQTIPIGRGMLEVVPFCEWLCDAPGTR